MKSSTLILSNPQTLENRVCDSMTYMKSEKRNLNRSIKCAMKQEKQWRCICPRYVLRNVYNRGGCIVKNNHHQTNTPQSIIIIIRVVTHFWCPYTAAEKHKQSITTYSILYEHSSRRPIKKHKNCFRSENIKRIWIYIDTNTRAKVCNVRVTEKRYYFTVVSHHDVMIIVNHLLKQVGRMVIKDIFCLFFLFFVSNK